MTNIAVYYFNICYFFNNKRLPQISQTSTDALYSKVLCKSAESVGVIILILRVLWEIVFPTEHAEFTEHSDRRFREFRGSISQQNVL